MNIPNMLCIALIASSVVFAGCNQDRNSDYPDHSERTARRVGEIHQVARDQKDAIGAEHDRISVKFDFDERQIIEKHKAERQEIINASSRDDTVFEAQVRDIDIQSRHDIGVIDAEAAEKMKGASPESHPDIQVDAASRKAEVDGRAAEKLSRVSSESALSKAKYAQSGREIDRNESKALSALEKDRAKSRDEMRDRMLKIDRWTNDELAKVADESASLHK